MLSHDFSLDAKSIHKLSSKGLCLQTLKEQIGDDLDFNLELWRAQGLDIIKERGSFYFSTKFMPISEATFCIVDIETNGSKIDKHQIIELGAVKVRQGKIIARYESLVKCNEINKHITEITGIKVEDTKDAPRLKQVLYEFKEFLSDDIFVAHDVKFDYRFISLSLQKIGLAPLLNRSLCTLDLSERTIQSYRYALSYLNEAFNLNPDATHHRAMSDVLTTTALFNKSINNLDKSIKNVEDLIRFSKNARRLKRPKFNPLLKVDL
ncbi:MAG: DNA polymerase III subunit epsilon [Sulfurimonas sp.]|nr:MAG: DNA polymerase III subunit epsilon [Sulfurimonas sp.]